jgi:hypothetical protein
MTKALVTGLIFVSLMLVLSLYSVYEEHYPLADNGQCIIIKKGDLDLVFFIEKHSNVTGTFSGWLGIKRFGVYLKVIQMKDVSYSDVRTHNYSAGECYGLKEPSK